MYNNKLLLLEKTRVWNFIKNRANEKSYPQEYLLKLKVLMDKIYEICLLPELKDLESFKTLDINEAMKFATKAHQSQRRRFVDLPYIIHPFEMATRLMQENFSHEAVIGALLHDVVEDCEVSFEMVEEKFGSKVKYYVYYLSDIAKPEDGNRAVRLDINFKHFQKSDFVTHDLKLTDLISNTRSLVLCDPRFAKSYVEELEKAVVYFQDNKKNLNNSLSQTLFLLTNLSVETVNLQQKFGIIKLESKKSKNII